MLLICISLTIGEVECFLMCPLAMCTRMFRTLVNSPWGSPWKAVFRALLSTSSFAHASGHVRPRAFPGAIGRRKTRARRASLLFWRLGLARDREKWEELQLQSGCRLAAADGRRPLPPAERHGLRPHGQDLPRHFQVSTVASGRQSASGSSAEEHSNPGVFIEGVDDHAVAVRGLRSHVPRLPGCFVSGLLEIQ